MAEEGYSYCPICQAVLPNHPDLEPDPQFKRILSHIKTHSLWSKYRAWRRMRKMKEVHEDRS